MVMSPRALPPVRVDKNRLSFPFGLGRFLLGRALTLCLECGSLDVAVRRIDRQHRKLNRAAWHPRIRIWAYFSTEPDFVQSSQQIGKPIRNILPDNIVVYGAQLIADLGQDIAAQGSRRAVAHVYHLFRRVSRGRLSAIHLT